MSVARVGDVGGKEGGPQSEGSALYSCERVGDWVTPQRVYIRISYLLKYMEIVVRSGDGLRTCGRNMCKSDCDDNLRNTLKGID